MLYVQVVKFEYGKKEGTMVDGVIWEDAAYRARSLGVGDYGTKKPKWLTNLARKADDREKRIV